MYLALTGKPAIMVIITKRCFCFRAHDKASKILTPHDKPEGSSQLLSSNHGRTTLVKRQPSSSYSPAGARKRSLLQEGVRVTHPCLHEGYVKDYSWVAHGAHVTALPKVQLHGR